MVMFEKVYRAINTSL